jgi:hypothetical protein
MYPDLAAMIPNTALRSFGNSESRTDRLKVACLRAREDKAIHLIGKLTGTLHAAPMCHQSKGRTIRLAAETQPEPSSEQRAGRALHEHFNQLAEWCNDPER